MKKNIALIGARGAGKSKICRRMAQSLKRPSFSTDSLISYEANGASIENIVKEYDWVGFREREFEVLERLCQMEDIVIDCGGGILVEAPSGEDGSETFSERKALCLSDHCTVIYLKRPIKFLMTKLDPDPNRPSLIGDYKSLLKRRLPWYENCADITVSLDHLGAKDALEKILEKMAKRNVH